MPYSEEWKLQHFYHMRSSQAKEIAKVCISTELNRLEGESLWRNPSSSTAAQQDNSSGDLQITLQEVIDMISGSIQEEMIGDDIVYEEMIGDDIVHEETIGDDWFDWIV